MNLNDLDNRSKSLIIIAAVALALLLGPYFGIRIFSDAPQALQRPDLSQPGTRTRKDDTPRRSVLTAAPQHDDLDTSEVIDELNPRKRKNEGSRLSGIEDLLQ